MFAGAMKVKSGQITSSPFPILRDLITKCRADEHPDVTIQYFTL